MKRLLPALAALIYLVNADGLALGNLIYSSGPVLGTDGAYGMFSPYSDSDSFTPSMTGVLESASVGLWTYAGEYPTSLQWSIGTMAFGSDIGSGTASSLTNVQFTPASNYGLNGQYLVYETTFALSGTLTAGTTYWFTLQNGTASGGGVVDWDDLPTNLTPAFQAYPGEGEGMVTVEITQSSFSLYGRTDSVPQPSSLVMLGIGLATIFVGHCWRQKRSA